MKKSKRYGVLEKIVLSGVIIAVSAMCGCSNTSGDTQSESSGAVSDVLEETKTDKDVISDALDALMNYDDTYLISTSISMPSETTNYVEVNDSMNSYTQYSMDEDGNLGQVSYEAANDTNFMLFDWLQKDNQGYIVNSMYNAEDSNSVQWMKLPESYVAKLLSRRVMYLDVMIDQLQDIESKGSESMTLGEDEIMFDLYKCKLPSDVVAQIMGIDTLGLYQSLRELDTASDNIKNLMDEYIAQLEMNLVFSDANVIIGINDGMVKYLNMEVGGLGSRMTCRKLFIEPDSSILYDKPTFESQGDYLDSMTELADYVAKYGSYEEAMNALYGGETAEGGVDGEDVEGETQSTTNGEESSKSDDSSKSESSSSSESSADSSSSKAE